MKQLKISKNINEVIGLPVSGAIVESKKILGPPDESKGNKSLFGVFSHVKVSDEDLNESKKIFEYEV